MAFDVTLLTDYIDENRFELFEKAVFNSPSIDLFNVQTGVKYKAKIHILSVDAEFKDCACGWNPSGDAVFSDREIEVGCVKVEDQFCMYDLNEHWTNQQLRITAGQESMGTIETALVNGVIADVAKKLDIAIWQGDTASANENLNKFDGLLKILDADVPAANKIVGTAGEAYYQTLLRAVAAIPQEALDKGAVAGLIGMQEYRQLIAYFTAKTITYTTDPIGENEERGTQNQPWFYLPGTAIRIYGIRGLSGTGQFVIASLNNLIFATDFRNDYETLDWWFSKDDDTFRYRIRFKAGAQVAFPDEVILGTFAGDADNTATGTYNVNILNNPLLVSNDGTFA